MEHSQFGGFALLRIGRLIAWRDQRRKVVFVEHAHQICDLAAERERQPDDGRKRRRLDASFQVVDVRERHPSLLRKGSHGFSALVPKLAQTLAEELRDERSQRLADRFRRWRASKMSDPPILGKPSPIGTSYRPIRRFRGSMLNVNGVLATLLAVRAFDREESQIREIEFRKTLYDVYNEDSSPFLGALLTLVERERRFARRFRSWRRAKAARGASQPSAPPPAGALARRKRL